MARSADLANSFPRPAAQHLVVGRCCKTTGEAELGLLFLVRDKVSDTWVTEAAFGMAALEGAAASCYVLAQEFALWPRDA